MKALLKLLACAIVGTLALSTPLQADQLTYYVYPSPLPMNWDTPIALIWSSLKNSLVLDDRYLNLHSIGHVNFKLECAPSNDLPHGTHLVTGQDSADDGEIQSQLLKEGFGFGTILSNHTGRWETEQEIEADLPRRFESGEISFIRFKIQPSTCTRISQYLDEYRRLGYDQIYGGLPARPRYRQGAGCSAFGESVLEIGGLMTPEQASAWSHSVNIPTELIGGPLTGHIVKLFDLFFGNHAHKWSSTTEESYLLKFWNPQKMIDWIHAKAQASKSRPDETTYEPITEGNAIGLAIDATQIPTPTDSFWLN